MRYHLYRKTAGGYSGRGPVRRISYRIVQRFGIGLQSVQFDELIEFVVIRDMDD